MFVKYMSEKLHSILQQYYKINKNNKIIHL